MLYILGVVLLVLTALSGLTILIQGYMPEDEDSNTTYIVVLMIASGLFGAFMTCLDKQSNVGIIWLSYILVLLGVLALISAVCRVYYRKGLRPVKFWGLMFWTLSIGLLAQWWLHAYDGYILEFLDIL